MLTTIEAVQDAVRSSKTPLRPRGAGTKPALSTPPVSAASLELGGLRGVLEYNPSEFVFTALAGTPVAEVEALLAEHGQYLPFDPLLAARGATLGGTVAAGLSGPGRYRYGGVRDFILGVKYIDGTGEVVRGGGKVVKNAAGFDLPKLFVGSLGQLGALVELSFKVFPRPEAYLTLSAAFADVDAAVQALLRLCGAPLDLHSVDLVPSERGSPELLVRLSGLASVLPARAERVKGLLGSCGVLEGTAEDEAQAWRAASELAWVTPGWTLIKVPLTPKRIVAFDTAVAALPSQRRYSAGGNVAWVATPAPVEAIDTLLKAQGMAGLVIMGPPGRTLIGTPAGVGFGERVKRALDEERRWAR